MQLYKSSIDRFKPGRTIRSCQLRATLSENSWTREVPGRSYLATLNGAKEPDNQMLIVIDPFVPPEQGINMLVMYV